MMQKNKHTVFGGGFCIEDYINNKCFKKKGLKLKHIVIAVLSSGRNFAVRLQLLLLFHFDLIFL